MKFETLLTAAFLAGSASAIGPASPHSPPRLKGHREKMANWRWPNPFASPHHAKFEPACEVERTLEAREYLLDDLGEKAPRGLLAYRDALKSVFSSREYPGSWDGIDPHGYDRHILTMRYTDMPLRVREWIEHQERADDKGRGLFAVYQSPMAGTRVLNTIKVPAETPVSEDWRARDERRIALFAPGALYEILPLFVADGSDCEDILGDLSKYSAKLIDGGVVAYPVNHTTPLRGQGHRDIEIKVKAQVLRLKEGEVAPEYPAELEAEAAKPDEEETKEAAESDKTEAAEKTEETEAAETPAAEAKEKETKSAEKEEL